MNRFILSILSTIFLSACVSAPLIPPELASVPEGRTRFIVFKTGDIYKKPGTVEAMSINTAKAFSAHFGATFIRPVAESNAFIIEANKKPKAPRGWTIEEEHIYHTHQIPPAEGLYKLIPFKCGTTPPAPTPTPTPTPTPGPAPIANVTWGQKAVGASEASAILPSVKVKVCDIDTGLDASVLGDFPSGTIKEGASLIQGEAWDYDKGSGHGTHTAGTIASSKYGVARITELYICKGLSSSNGSGSSSSLAGCINKCRAWGAKVINASWGMDRGTDQTIGTAVDGFVSAGGVFVASAGNSSGGPIGFPASKSNVIAVTSLDQQGRISYFSSRGSKTGDMVIAPGSDIPSLPNGKTMSGTSMSAPHVTAIQALAIAKGLRQVKTVTKNLPTTEEGRGMASAIETVK